MSYSEINNPPTVSCMAVNLLAMKYTYVRAHSFLSLADTHDFQNLMVQFFKRANESRNLALASCFVSLSCLCKENGFSSFFFFPVYMYYICMEVSKFYRDIRKLERIQFNRNR